MTKIYDLEECRESMSQLDDDMLEYLSWVCYKELLEIIDSCMADYGVERELRAGLREVVC